MNQTKIAPYILQTYKQEWSHRLATQLNTIIASHQSSAGTIPPSTADNASSPDNTSTINGNLQTLTIKPADLQCVNCTNISFGNISFPLFAIAKRYRIPLTELADRLLISIKHEIASGNYPNDTVEHIKGYINITFDKPHYMHTVIDSVLTMKQRYGAKPPTAHRVLIEFSSPNSNKPLHLGHLRNNALGESLSRVYKACGYTVKKVNLINDRGIHICKAMLSYLTYGSGHTPQDENKKPDYFVGDYYVKFNKLLAVQGDVAHRRAQQMLKKWEENDPATLELWSKIRGWVLEGLNQTYRNTDITFDWTQFESETYLLGKKLIERGIKQRLFTVNDDNSVSIDLTDDGLGTKTLLRGDGTSIYVTQDLGTLVERLDKWHADKMIYVVGDEQNHHFNVLFNLAQKLNITDSEQLSHCSYGMVRLPDGNMKSRAGNVVEADELIDGIKQLLVDNQNSASVEPEKHAALTATSTDATDGIHHIAVSAIHYYLLKVDRRKDIMFDVQKSISLTGNSGLYILYTVVRITSIFNKRYANDFNATSQHDATEQTTALQQNNTAELWRAHQLHDLEWELTAMLATLPDVVQEAATAESPHVLADFAYQLSKKFNQYYHQVPIITHDAAEHAKLCLIASIKIVLQRCCKLLVMHPVAQM